MSGTVMCIICRLVATFTPNVDAVAEAERRGETPKLSEDYVTGAIDGIAQIELASENYLFDVCPEHARDVQFAKRSRLR